MVHIALIAEYVKLLAKAAKWISKPIGGEVLYVFAVFIAACLWVFGQNWLRSQGFETIALLVSLFGGLLLFFVLIPIALATHSKK